MTARRAGHGARSLAVLAGRIEACRDCPRLVQHRELIARTKRRAYRDETYWGRPVAGFGDPNARLVIVGLAPGAHGANRTGRIFTGDRSGEFLYAALHRAGFANQPTSVGRDDGLRLSDVFITMPVRCVPPDNHPTRSEIETCRPWFRAELEQLTRVSSVLALGKLGFDEVVRLARTVPVVGDAITPLPRFAHGGHASLPWPFGHREITLFGSYHVSQQNTQTGRLTPAMFDDVLAACARAAGIFPPQPQT